MDRQNEKTTSWNIGRALGVSLALGMLATAGCGFENEDGRSVGAQAPIETSRLALTTDVLADTDIGGMRYTVEQVDCATGAPITPPFTETADTELEDMYIPGGNGTFENAPFDANSQHLFADQFFDLPAGCYDVLVEPIQADGELSEDCWSAHQDTVEVMEGATTEIFLILQCRGEARGGLDVIAGVNHPPALGDLQFNPSKFTCEERTEVCVDITDPDSDPVNVEWSISGNAQVASTSQTTSDEGVTTACAILSSEEPGSYDVSVTAYDMAYDDDGNLVPIEDLLAAQGDPHPSRVSLTFPFHVLSEEACINTCECPEGFELNPAEDGCIMTETVEATRNETTYQVCKGDTNGNYSRDGAQYPDGLIVENSFWGESYNDWDSRLNTVGVWACDPASIDTGETYPTTEPTQEWIGFSHCLDVAESGEYLIGMGADNRMRFKINGTMVFERNTNAVPNFTYWWVQSVHLNAGLNIIELEGWNQSQVAAFGAEIAGPFPSGSLSTDAAMAAADYENNIIFSTEDMIGQDFQLGETSGYSCPDGYALNTCGEAPSCTQIVHKSCE